MLSPMNLSLEANIYIYIYIYMEEKKTLRVARVEEKNCQGLYSSILGFFRMILIDWFFLTQTKNIYKIESKFLFNKKLKYLFYLTYYF